MTGLTEASIVYLTSDFSWERSVKKFTAVPQLGPGLIKTPLNLEWTLIRSRIAPLRCILWLQLSKLSVFSLEQSL